MKAQDQTWLKKMEELFFRGALAGWAGGNNGILMHNREGIPGLEDWREVVFKDHKDFPGFVLTDCWGDDPDSIRPSGHLQISYWKTLMWSMWVGGGSYDIEVFPFLREVLKDTYERKQFFGGRGPLQYSEGNLLYSNKYVGDFSRFYGREEIHHLTKDGKKFAGSHDYWGGSFVFQKKL